MEFEITENSGAFSRACWYQPKMLELPIVDQLEVIDRFPSQGASNAENVSMFLRYRADCKDVKLVDKSLKWG